jgi:hypothetical protein
MSKQTHGFSPLPRAAFHTGQQCVHSKQFNRREIELNERLGSISPRWMPDGGLPSGPGGTGVRGLYQEPRFSHTKTKRRDQLGPLQLADKKADNNSFILAALDGYLITLSARASTFGGIVRPICLAALRLITSSNFIAASTGRSAGMAPFRILSTYVAARRARSTRLVE